MANSTPRKRTGKAAPPAPKSAPDPAVAPVSAPAPVAKRRTGWRTAGIVAGAVLVLALVFGVGLAFGFGLGRGPFSLSRLHVAAGSCLYGPRQGGDWVMPYHDDGRMPFAPYHALPDDGFGMIPRGRYGSQPLGAAYLGVSYAPLSADLAQQEDLSAGEGALISSVIDGSPAAEAGLQAGDIVLSVDGQRLLRAGLLQRLIRAHAPGDEVSLDIRRGGNELTIVVTLGRLPDNAVP